MDRSSRSDALPSRADALERAASAPRERLCGDDLGAVERAIWDELVRAIQQRPAAGAPAHAWRRAVLATTDADGPQVRSVVLRDIDRARRALLFYTDARSAKVGQLRHDPRAQLLCWSEALGWQIRLRCQIGIETSGLDVTARWAQVRHSPAAQDYLSPLAPGAAIGAPFGAWRSVVGMNAAPAATAAGRTPPPMTDHPRDSFAVLTARVEAIDWLELHPEGHRRARFEAGNAHWLVP
ncbi:MAG: pyridoxamine 5'-phosphate oxidase family protein [Leptothrix sp. (in: b-proteobacteria)]